MTQDEILKIVDYIVSFLINYFSVKQNRIFWILIFFFAVIIENSIKIWKKRNYMKIWLKSHNIGAKYKKHKKIYKNELPKTQYDKQHGYIESIWEELNK